MQREERIMEFGYFTLSDNHYDNNKRGANQFIEDITNEALYADQLGMHSAWIGEHHFNSLGVLVMSRSGPRLHRWAHQAHPARARGDGDAAAPPDPRRRAMGDARPLGNGRVDFAAGRGYDSREYAPFHVDFTDNQSIFEEGMEVIQKLWAAETASRTTASTTSSTTCASRRSRSRIRCRPISARSPSPRSSSPRGSATD